ncbi:MAG: thiamine pyrophosphate-dependent enzyme [Cytophagales bacterium]|nr:thiamine pyrophosphate-dependent enzyme [Cytophagales bacterium]
MTSINIHPAQDIRSYGLSIKDILNDYKIAWASRNASLIGRKEVFLGRAKFGVFGDGKEVAQVAMARFFKNGDHRSGYYRDQTFMFASGLLNIQQFFAQLYAHTDLEAEPASGGRLMNGHFSTRMLDELGNWKDQTKMKNSSADVSPTAAQMPRLVGLAWASKLYRENKLLESPNMFSVNGNEVAFGTIGNASTSEGIFFESINAAAVLQIPMVLSIWDDGYGISVPNEYHTPKVDISKVLEGFRRSETEKGLELFRVNGWDYLGLIKAYKKATELARERHIPSLIHVAEMTQPLGHSTSGSHERYKSKERLAWEAEFDCLKKMREWILENELAHQGQLDGIEAEAIKIAKEGKDKAWEEYTDVLRQDKKEALELLDKLNADLGPYKQISTYRDDLEALPNPLKLETIKALKYALRYTRNQSSNARLEIRDWLKTKDERNQKAYSSHIYSESKDSALKVKEVKAVYSKNSKIVDGREVLLSCFDAALSRDPRVLAFGEDVGKIGDVNQAFAGLQDKYGEIRVMDTSIRETTIVGQGIGVALRGLRPIAEIQYLDYLIYTIQTMSDDLACVQYRTVGGQKSPVIIRTRGHRLEGVWHSGSPLGMILNSIRGILVLVPRNMTQAAGFYNAMLKSDEPALIIETLNAYRLKERIPDNIGEFTVPIGVPEVLNEGTDCTIVTYGAMCRIAMDAAKQLADVGISLEVIDVQTLLPFDVHRKIVESVKKTNRVIFADEDVSGGASAFMMHHVLEEQNGYQYLDSKPVTLNSKDHRPAYSSDGDYFSKVNAEDIYDTVYRMLNEVNPVDFPEIY